MANIETLVADTHYFSETSAPSTPSSGQLVVYGKTTGLFYKTDAGTEVGPLAASGAVTYAGCSIYHSTTQNPANPGVLAFDTELFDSDAFHDPSSNNSRITIPSGKAGKYLVTFGTSSSSTTSPACRLKKNGTTVISINWYPSPSTYINGSVVVNLAVADYVEIERSGTGTLGHASAFEAQTQVTASLIGA